MKGLLIILLATCVYATKTPTEREYDDYITFIIVAIATVSMVTLVILNCCVEDPETTAALVAISKMVGQRKTRTIRKVERRMSLDKEEARLLKATRIKPIEPQGPYLSSKRILGTRSKRK